MLLKKRKRKKNKMGLLLFLRRYFKRLKSWYGRFWVRLFMFIIHNRYPVFHYYFAYLYVMLYVQIAIRLLGFTLDEFALQCSDVSAFWGFLIYDLLFDFYEDWPEYSHRIEFESIDEGLAYILSLDPYLGISMRLFPYYISFVSLF